MAIAVAVEAFVTVGAVVSATPPSVESTVPFADFGAVVDAECALAVVGFHVCLIELTM